MDITVDFDLEVFPAYYAPGEYAEAPHAKCFAWCPRCGDGVAFSDLGEGQKMRYKHVCSTGVRVRLGGKAEDTAGRWLLQCPELPAC